MSAHWSSAANTDSSCDGRIPCAGVTGEWRPVAAARFACMCHTSDARWYVCTAVSRHAGSVYRLSFSAQLMPVCVYATNLCIHTCTDRRVIAVSRHLQSQAAHALQGVGMGSARYRRLSTKQRDRAAGPLRCTRLGRQRVPGGRLHVPVASVGPRPGLHNNNAV